MLLLPTHFLLNTFAKTVYAYVFGVSTFYPSTIVRPNCGFWDGSSSVVFECGF
jgi:hypothetical protein